jgi:4-hydroxybenzoate polyprenyltransferase
MDPLTTFTNRARWLFHRVTATTLFTDVLPGASGRARSYMRLLRLDKPIGIWLLLWPVLWALWLASEGKPTEHIFLVFVIGTVLTRSAGCAINDYADRKIDPLVARTKDRPLAKGEIDPGEAIMLSIALGLAALGLTLTLNTLTWLLALGGAFLLLTYPLMKRFFALPQVYLGAAFTWGVPMAFAAETNAVPRVAWLMFMAGVLWTTAYDTMYAMVDREDDLKIGVRSSAVLFGDADRFIIGVMQLMALLALWFVGSELKLGLWFRLGLVGAGMCALHQQLLIRERKPADCFHAFLNSNYFGMSVFIGIFLDFLFRVPEAGQ